jgi:FkbM family methyltransferase
MPDSFHTSGKPIVFAMHGRPDSSVRLDAADIVPVVRAFAGKAADCRYKAFITYWPEHIAVWEKIIPKSKLFLVSAMIDIEAHRKPVEPFDFGKYKGRPNLLIADVWREDVVPVDVLFAAERFVKRTPGAKVHIIGLPKEYMKAMMPFFSSMRQSGALGLISGQTTNIYSIYAASDIVLTPHVIATRIVRESLARGIPLVAGQGCPYTPYQAAPSDYKAYSTQIERCWRHLQTNGELTKRKCRELADAVFGLQQAGEAVKKVYSHVLNRPTPKRKKWFIDLGGHLGQSIRRFYRQVEDADKYNIVSFEPEPETFAKLLRNVGHIPNIELINKAATTHNNQVDFYPGKANENEGGTTLKGKQTGAVDYGNPVKVDAVDFCKWLKETVKQKDYVVIKINIEGGEYDLMEKMLKDKVTHLIDEVYIQLHSHKFPQGPDRWKYQKIESEFYQNAKCRTYMQNKGFVPFKCN